MKDHTPVSQRGGPLWVDSGRYNRSATGQVQTFLWTHPQDENKRKPQAMTTAAIQKFIASQDLIWLLSNGKERSFCVKVAEPYQIDTRTWACPIWLDGLEEQPRNIYGVSSLQALCQSLSHVGNFFERLIDDGEMFIYPQDRSVFDKQFLWSVFGFNIAKN